MDKRPALGKGLSALIPDAPEPRIVADSRSTSIACRRTPFSRAGRSTTRGLDELAQSIKSNGIIQPIVVRKVGDRFQIIAGERRWRAAQKAGLLRVPVVVRDVRAGPGAIAPRDGAHREHPARESESDRRSARLPPAGRRVPADAGRDRRGGRQGSRDGRQLPAPAEAARRSARRGRVRHAVDGPCARAAGAADARPTSAASRATSSRASLSVRETESLVKKIAEATPRRRRAGAGQAGRRPHAGGRGPAAPRRSARASASSATARAAGSRSTSAPRTS